MTSLMTQLQPLIEEALLVAILAALTWATRLLPDWLRLRIDAGHREALHSALRTGVSAAIERAEAHLAPHVAAAQVRVDEVLDYVERSVPGALKHFAPSRQQLEDMARAKIADALTEALKAAGAPT